MRSNMVLVAIVIALAVIAVGYGTFRTTPSSAAVDAKLLELTPTHERKPVNESILADKTLKDIEAFKVFGQHPVRPDAGSLNRTNPFDGI